MKAVWRVEPPRALPETPPIHERHVAITGTVMSPTHSASTRPKTSLHAIAHSEASRRRVQWDTLRFLAPLLHETLNRPAQHASKLSAVLSIDRLDISSRSLIHYLLNADTQGREGLVRRDHFVSAFLNLLKKDPFQVSAKLTALFDAYDLDQTGMANMQEFACALHLVTHPFEQPLETLMWCFDVFAVKNRLWRGDKYIMANAVPVILGVPCETDAEANTIRTLARQTPLGVPQKFVARHDFETGVCSSPELLRTFGVLCKQRLPFPMQRRVQCTQEAAEHQLLRHRAVGAAPHSPIQAASSVDVYSTDGGQAALARIRPRSAAALNRLKAMLFGREQTMLMMRHQQSIHIKFRIQMIASRLASIPASTRTRFIFSHWRQRSATHHAKMCRFAAADAAYRRRQLQKWIDWWAYRTHYMQAKMYAIEHGHRRKLRQCFMAWFGFVHNAKMVKRLKAQSKPKLFDTVGRSTNDTGRDAVYRSTWLPLVFNAIKATALHYKRKKQAGLFNRRRLKAWALVTWRATSTAQRNARRQRKQARREQQLAEELAEEQRKAQEAVQEAIRLQVLKDRAAREEVWKTQVKRAELRFEIKAVMAAQQELRTFRRKRDAAARRALLDEAWAETAVRYKQRATDEIAQYLATEVGRAEFVRKVEMEVVQPLVSKNVVESDEAAKYRGLVWQLAWDALKVCRKFYNTETKASVYRQRQTGVDASMWITATMAQQIVRENLIAQRYATFADQMAADRQTQLDHDRFGAAAVIIQRWIRCKKHMESLRLGVRRFISAHKRQRNDAYEALLHRSAKCIQNNWRAIKDHSALAKLVWSLYGCRTDPESGHTYYFHRLTGVTWWEPPAILRSRMTGNVAKTRVPDWELIITDKGHYYYNSSIDEKRFKPPAGYYMCQDCKRLRFATKHCRQCGDYYCDLCFRKTHKRGARAIHGWIPVYVSVVRCASCQDRKAVQRCYDCDAAYCEPCCAYQHDTMETRTHDVYEM